MTAPVFNADGTVTLELGSAAGGRSVASLVEAAMRGGDGVPVFWPETPEAKRARREMPRPPSLLAGDVRGVRTDGGRVLARLGLGEKLAGLLRRLPEQLHFVWRGDHFEVTTGRGAGPMARAALVEAAVSESEERGMSMTLAEALATDEVRGYLRGLVREEAEGVAPPGQPERPARPLSGPETRLALIESLSAPRPQRRAGSSFAEACRDRGLDAASFGMPSGDAA